MFSNWRKNRAKQSAVRSVESWKHGDRPVLQVRSLREFEQAYVVDRFYRPTGYVWKQSLAKDQRLERAAQLRQIEIEGKDLNFQAAYYGLLYRLDVFSAGEAKSVGGLLLASMPDATLPSEKQKAKQNSTAFDLLMMQHTNEAWASLAANGEYILQTAWAPRKLKELAADMAVQARYQQVKPKILQNSVQTDHIVQVSKTVTLAEDALGGETPAIKHYRGLIAAMEGKLDLSAKCHAGASAGGYRTQFFRAAENIVPIDVMRNSKLESLVLPSKVSWQMRRAGSYDCYVSMVTADKSYFDQFFVGFAQSFALQNPNGVLHFHGAGFKPPVPLILELEQQLKLSINVTYDDMNMTALSADLYKGYAAAARYLILPQLLKHYAAVLVHDIDGVVDAAMKKIWNASEADIQISSLVLDPRRKGHLAFWSNVAAGAFAVRRSDNSLRFVASLANYLVNRFKFCKATGARYFFTDQIGLMLAVLAFKDDVSMSPMPQIFSQLNATLNTGRTKAKKEKQAELLENARRAKTSGGLN